MTNKEFFLQLLEAERPTFLKVLQAIPADKLDYKPHEKARSLGNLASQLGYQWAAISSAATKGSPNFGEYGKGQQPMDEIIMSFNKNYDQMLADLKTLDDQDWENNTAKMEWPGGKWETKKFEMCWGFLFDAVHHRGQLTTYLRAMGEKVPSVYGGSADDKPAGM